MMMMIIGKCVCAHEFVMCGVFYMSAYYIIQHYII